MTSPPTDVLSAFLDLVVTTPEAVLDVRGARELECAVRGAADALGIFRFYPGNTHPRIGEFMSLADMLCLRYGGNGQAFEPLISALSRRLKRYSREHTPIEAGRFDETLVGMRSKNARHPVLYIGVHSWFGLIQYVRGALAATLLRFPERESAYQARLSYVETQLRRELGVGFGPWHQLLRLVTYGADSHEGVERFLTLWFEYDAVDPGNPNTGEGPTSSM